MLIVKLDVEGPEVINIGVYSSVAKANKVFQLFKEAHKGTVWQNPKKILHAWDLDRSFDGSPI